MEEEHDRGKKLKRNAETERTEQEQSGEEPRVKKRRRSAPGTVFELPAGFTIIKRTSRTKSYKEYLGPDGTYLR